MSRGWFYALRDPPGANDDWIVQRRHWNHEADRQN